MAIFIPVTEEDKAFHNQMLEINTREKLFEHYVYPYNAHNYKRKASLAFSKGGSASHMITFHIELFSEIGYYPISDMTQQEVYDVAMQMYCEAISMGDKRAKTELAEHLLKKDNPFLTYDKQLGEFLMQVGLLEKQLGACIYFGETWEIEPNDNIINFWSNLFNQWFGEDQKKWDKPRRPKLGIKLDLTYDKENRRFVFNCPDNQELE